MATTLSPITRTTRDSLPLWMSGIVTIVLAALAGAALYGIARAAGTLPHSVLVPTPAGEEPITLAPVLAASAQGALLGAIVYALLRRVTARANRLFWIIGGIVLALSLIPPLTTEDAPARMVVTLVAMHLVVGLVTLATLTGLTAPRHAG